MLQREICGRAAAAAANCRTYKSLSLSLHVYRGWHSVHLLCILQKYRTGRGNKNSPVCLSLSLVIDFIIAFPSISTFFVRPSVYRSLCLPEGPIKNDSPSSTDLAVDVNPTTFGKYSAERESLVLLYMPSDNAIGIERGGALYYTYHFFSSASRYHASRNPNPSFLGDGSHRSS